MYDADEAEQERQRLLFRTQAVTAANRAVWVAVETLLGRVLGRVRESQHRKACRVAALVMQEILHPDSGRDRREVDRRILAIEIGRRSTAELAADAQLMHRLHGSVTATAHRSGWSLMSAVSEALRHTDPDWTAARWGHKSDIALIAATRQFAIRHVPREGQQVLEVRARRQRQVGNSQ
ncbi:hypothetical protein ACWDSJ_27770 [Nocardia sp. NPDC003482]